MMNYFRSGHRPCLAAFALAGAVFAAMPCSAAGAVFKCAGPDRVPVYQDRPCAPQALLRDFATDPPPLSVLPTPVQAPVAGTKSPTKRSARAEHREAAPSAQPSRRSRPPAVQGDATLRRFLHQGLTDGEVIARVGRPQATRGGKRSAARWIYLPAPGDPQTVTIVSFRDGVVVDIDRRIAK